MSYTSELQKKWNKASKYGLSFADIERETGLSSATVKYALEHLDDSRSRIDTLQAIEKVIDKHLENMRKEIKD